MTGAQYRANVRLSTKDNETLAESGETCERVPDVSLAWLIAQNLVAPIRSSESASPVAQHRNVAVESGD